MAQRYMLIDAMRFLFAFCVVLIHVPMKGGSCLEFIYRCAVPFFYVVTGYFVFRPGNIGDSFLRTSKKWFHLFIKYFIIITIFSILLHIILIQSLHVDIQDFIDLIVWGNIKSLDEIQIHDISCGLYVHWFLLGGAYAFIFLYVAKKFLSTKRFYIIILCLYVVCLYLVINDVRIPRWIYLSIPYVTLGFYIKNNQTKLQTVFCNNKIKISIFLFAFAEWIIFKATGVKSECYFLTPLLVSILFLGCLTDKNNNIVSFLSEMGTKHTLNIYIYHRFAYVVALMVFGKCILPFAAPLVFVLVLAVSILSEKLCHQKVLKKRH